MQMGVTKVVVHPLEIGDGKTHWSYDDILKAKNWLESAGLEFSVLEGSVPISDRIRLGQEGRDENIDVFKQFLHDCGNLGIPIVCYDWMVGVRWACTEAHIDARGGSLVTGYDNEKVGDDSAEINATQATHEQLWEAFEYFLDEVGPVAEEVGVKLALHPDDPPRKSLRGIPRIINSVDAYDRVL